MGKLLPSHRSTTYPCSVPGLGDSAGAGRERLTRRKGNINFYFTINFANFVGIQKPCCCCFYTNTTKITLYYNRQLSKRNV